jgi:hypothetical membrane protein
MAGHPSDYPDTLVRIGALSGIGGSLLYLAMVAVTGRLTSGYNPVTQWISELGAVGAPHALPFNVFGQMVFGLSALLFALGLYRALGAGWRSAAAAAFVGIAGIAGILEGIFPCDPGCIPVTPTGSLHLSIGIVPLIAVLAAMECFAFGVRNRPEWRWFFPFSQAMVAATIVFAIAFSSVPACDGLFQRLMIGSILLWILAVSARMLRL